MQRAASRRFTTWSTQREKMNIKEHRLSDDKVIAFLETMIKNGTTGGYSVEEVREKIAEIKRRDGR